MNGLEQCKLFLAKFFYVDADKIDKLIKYFVDSDLRILVLIPCLFFLLLRWWGLKKTFSFIAVSAIWFFLAIKSEYILGNFLGTDDAGLCFINLGKFFFFILIGISFVYFCSSKEV